MPDVGEVTEEKVCVVKYNKEAVPIAIDIPILEEKAIGEKKEEKAKEDGYSPYKRYPPFQIWDMPPEIASSLQDYARKEAGNRCWMAVKLLLERVEKEDELKEVRQSHLEELAGINAKLTLLVEANSERKSKEALVKTFGGEFVSGKDEGD
jgi:hypothetical protein